MATEAFTQAGFDAHNMTGGLLDWDGGWAPARARRRHVADWPAGRLAGYGFHLIEQPTGLVSASSGSRPASTASSASRSQAARWPGSS